MFLKRCASVDGYIEFIGIRKRGLNKNTNGLIRQYIAKGNDFTELTDADIMCIQERLNNRPRKSLGYATQNEVFENGISADVNKLK